MRANVIGPDTNRTCAGSAAAVAGRLSRRTSCVSAAKVASTTLVSVLSVVALASCGSPAHSGAGVSPAAAGETSASVPRAYDLGSDVQLNVGTACAIVTVDDASKALQTKAYPEEPNPSGLPFHSKSFCEYDNADLGFVQMDIQSPAEAGNPYCSGISSTPTDIAADAFECQDSSGDWITWSTRDIRFQFQVSGSTTPQAALQIVRQLHWADASQSVPSPLDAPCVHADVIAIGEAADAYKRDNGSFPSRLSELVPKYLPSVPDHVGYTYEGAQTDPTIAVLGVPC